MVQSLKVRAKDQAEGGHLFTWVPNLTGKKSLDISIVTPMEAFVVLSLGIQL